MIGTQNSEDRYLGFEKKKDMFLRLQWWRDTD